MSNGALESGQHRVEINCPHVENGACADCLWPQIMPYVGARQTLDDLLPKLTKLSEVLNAFAADVGRIAKATDKVREWAERRAASKWELGEPSRADGNETR